MADENKELVTKAPTAIDRPHTRGHENHVAQEDMLIPRVMLIQFTPPKTVEIDPAVITPGKIINSVTVQELPKDAKGYPFIPIKRSVNWVRFNPQKQEDPNFDPSYEMGAMIWSSNDPKDPRVLKEGAWGPKSEPPLATKFINYLAWFPGLDFPAVLSFARTSFKAGKALTTMTEMLHRADDLFRWKYRLLAKQEQNDQKQKYYVLAVEEIGRTTDEEFAKAEEIYGIFAEKAIDAYEDDAAATAEPAKEPQPWDK